MRGHGYRYLTADEIVAEHPLILRGLVLLVSTTGGDVTLYDGLEAAGGRLIGRFEAIADQSTPIDLFGLHVEHGLFVDIGSNVTSVLVVYDPLHSPDFMDPPATMERPVMVPQGY